MTTVMLLAAKRYALSDPSDPFAYARAKAHLRNGVASFAGVDGKGAYYAAAASPAPGPLCYRNVVRP